MKTTSSTLFLRILNIIILVYLPLIFVGQMINFLGGSNALQRGDNWGEDLENLVILVFSFIVFAIQLDLANKFRPLFKVSSGNTAFKRIGKSSKHFYLALLIIWWIIWLIALGLTFGHGITIFILVLFSIGIIPIHLLSMLRYGDKNKLFE